MMKRFMMAPLALMLAAVMAVTPALASFCGCSSAPLTTRTMELAKRLAPLQAALPAVAQQQMAVEMMLLDFSYQFNQPYDQMTPAEKASHYQEMVRLSARRGDMVKELAQRYRAAGAPPQVVQLLNRHAATFRQAPAERVAYIRDLPQMEAKAQTLRDAVLADGLASLAESCDKLADGDLAACVDRAVNSSTPDSDAHFSAYASMAGPAAMLAGRLKDLAEGAPVIAPLTKTAALD